MEGKEEGGGNLRLILALLSLELFVSPCRDFLDDGNGVSVTHSARFEHAQLFGNIEFSSEDDALSDSTSLPSKMRTARRYSSHRRSFRKYRELKCH